MKNTLKQLMSSATKTLILVVILFCVNSAVKSQVISTIAGNGIVGYLGDGGFATNAELNLPRGVYVSTTGDVYIADCQNNTIRKITTSTGIITTVAGNGTAGFSGDGGTATSAQLYQPTSVCTDNFGNVYFADCQNNRIRKVTVSTGIITTIAGTTQGYSGDGGLAVDAQFYLPWGICLDDSNNIYIADQLNNRIRKVTISTGIITTIVGTGTAGFSGDGGLAIDAQIAQPCGICIDDIGNIYIADRANVRIRKVSYSDGMISTIAGTGFPGFSGDGWLAISAQFYDVWGISVDVFGNIYIADTDNHRVRKVTISTGIIETIAGNGNGSYSGDGGLATNAELNYPNGVTVDIVGNVYIADRYNNRIRKVSCTTSTYNEVVLDTTYSNNLSSIDTIVGTQIDTIANIIITTTDSMFITTYVNTTTTIKDSTVFTLNQCSGVTDSTMYADTVSSSVVVLDTVLHQSSDTVLINTGVESVGLPSNLKVYPNPFTNEINIDVGDETVDVVLTDALGRMIMQTRGSGYVVLRSNVLSGVYFLRIPYKNKAPVVIKVIAE